MPGPITWRDVAAPDISTSVQALGLAGRSLADAGTAASSALGAFQANRQADATNLLAQKVASFSDPNALKAAVAADPTLGVDPNLVTAAAMKGVQDHVDSLLANAQTQAGTAQTTQQTTNAANAEARTGTVFDEGQTAYKNYQAAAPEIAAALGSNDNSPAGLAKSQSALAAIAAKHNLDPVQLASFMKDNAGNSQSSADLASRLLGNVGQSEDNVGKGISNNNAAFLLSNAKEDRQAQTDAAQLTLDLNAAVDPSDPNSFASAFGNLSSKYSPRAQLLALNDAAARYPQNAAIAAQRDNLAGSMSTGLTASTVPGAGSGTANYDAVYGNGKYGAPAVPVSQQTLANVINTGNNLINATKGKIGQGDLGTSASGAYQIIGSTLKTYAPKVFGANWQNVQYTPENQDKLAEAIFNDNKGNASKLASQWTSLKNYSPQQQQMIAQLPWDQARNFITQGESGGPIQQNIQKAAADATTGIIQAAGNSSGLGPAGPTILAAAQNTGATAQSEAARIAAKIGAKPQDLIDRINQVVQQGGVNPATAGAIVEANLGSKGSGGFLSSILGNSTNIGNSGYSFNDQGISNAVAAVKGGNFPKQVSAYNDAVATSGNLTNLRTQQAQTQALLSHAVQLGQARGPSGLAMIPRIKQLQSQLAAINSQLTSATLAATVAQGTTQNQKTAEADDGSWIKLVRTGG